jgi:hypothetical protein
MLPDATVAAAHPVEVPSHVGSSLDWRRVRAALVTVLRKASDEGDALLTETDVLTRMETLELAQPCVVSTDWLNGNQEHLIGEIERNEIVLDPAEGIAVSCLQLTDLCKGEQRLARLLGARIAATLSSLGEDWTQLLIATVEEGGTRVRQNNPRHTAALKEQSEALERVTCRKLGCVPPFTHSALKRAVLLIMPTVRRRLHTDPHGSHMHLSKQNQQVSDKCAQS